MFEWNPAAALPGDGDEYEELLGPEGGDDLGGGGGGGSLLDGAYDEGESAASFQDAVAAWRAGNAAPAPAAGGAFGGTATSGSLLDGAFDEDESAASFQEALRAFRGGARRGRRVAAARRRAARRRPAPRARASRRGAAAADARAKGGGGRARARRAERAAPRRGGGAGERDRRLRAEGTLLEQVQRLVVQTGVSVGAAAEAAGTRAPPKQPPRPPPPARRRARVRRTTSCCSATSKTPRRRRSATRRRRRGGRASRARLVLHGLYSRRYGHGRGQRARGARVGGRGADHDQRGHRQRIDHASARERAASCIALVTATTTSGSHIRLGVPHPLVLETVGELEHRRRRRWRRDSRQLVQRRPGDGFGGGVEAWRRSPPARRARAARPAS